MPGHMNVLLAEAEIPYEALVEMDEINPEMPQMDVCVVVGANDVVNPAARSDKSSPIYGMPIIDADKARVVLANKRSMNPGFAGIDNALYSADNTLMVFGDAKSVLGDIAAALRAEREAIDRALVRFRWNRRKAAQYLNVSYKTLLNKIKECGISETPPN
jgi:NAD(P) transhydrogenase subunit beta